MRGTVVLTQALTKWFMGFRMWLPKGFVIIFVFIQVASVFAKEGIVAAFKELATIFLAAEQAINVAVTLAINNAPEYNLMQFFGIINALLIIYYYTWFMTRQLIKYSGSQAAGGAAGFALLSYFVIEFAAVNVLTTGGLSFVPFKDGVLFLLLNLKPVFTNIHFFNFVKTSIESAQTVPVQDMLTNTTGG